jgi:hypothetical protein
VPNRFDQFPKFELNILWQSLYDYREKLLAEHGAEYNFEADDVTKLIDTIYGAEHWRDTSVNPRV